MSKNGKNQNSNVHLDLNLNEDGTISFSSHMIGEKKV